MNNLHSIRIPVHGFVEFNDWEREIINHPVFQRLRRIRQLSFCDQLFPGATHTRFEHSLGVMHIATKLYDSLTRKYGALLEDRLGCHPDKSRARTFVRLAALLHDVGHGPFSHTSEDLMPGASGEKYDHEDYSALLVRKEMADVIDNHPFNQAHDGVTSAQVADFYLGRPTIAREVLFWKELVSGQIDADRMDYLLRDSLHCGVAYGQFDLDRIIDTLTVVESSNEDSTHDLRIGIEEGGMHAAEGLILARYFMFTQVYFHPVRKAYDNHVAECIRSTLRKKSNPHGLFPGPDSARGRKAFLSIDDWRITSAIHAGKCGRHGTAIVEHRHDRCVANTSEVPKKDEIESHQKLLEFLKSRIEDVWDGQAEKEWYKVNQDEIWIARDSASKLTASRADPLSEKSEVVPKINDSKQLLIFVPKEDAKEARRLARELKTTRG